MAWVYQDSYSYDMLWETRLDYAFTLQLHYLIIIVNYAFKLQLMPFNKYSI